jgi:hypothetical protein
MERRASFFISIDIAFLYMMYISPPCRCRSWGAARAKSGAPSSSSLLVGLTHSSANTAT